MESSRNRRSWKNYLINKNVQLRITAINLVFMGVAVLVNTAIILTSSLCNIYYTGEGLWTQVLDMYALSSDLLVISLVVTFVLAVISQILLTHQFCGPLINFSHSFSKISQGDLTRKVHLRNRDLLKPEADQFNDMVTNLSHHVEALKADNQILIATLKDVTADPNRLDNVAKARQILIDNEQRFQDHIDKLKVATESNLAN